MLLLALRTAIPSFLACATTLRIEAESLAKQALPLLRDGANATCRQSLFRVLERRVLHDNRVVPHALVQCAATRLLPLSPRRGFHRSRPQITGHLAFLVAHVAASTVVVVQNRQDLLQATSGSPVHGRATVAICMMHHLRKRAGDQMNALLPILQDRKHQWSAVLGARRGIWVLSRGGSEMLLLHLNQLRDQGQMCLAVLAAACLARLDGVEERRPAHQAQRTWVAAKAT